MLLLQATFLRCVNQYLPVHVHPCIVLATAAALVWKSPAMQSSFESGVILSEATGVYVRDDVITGHVL